MPKAAQIGGIASSHCWQVFAHYGLARSKSAFKALNGKAVNVIHIATHGFFTEKIERESLSGDNFLPYRLCDNPMIRSGLIMSGSRANAETPDSLVFDDGILTAMEISHMDLSQTELVVLSACQTGLGDIDNSEGVYGLQRAFKMAGVNYIIMSLWNVPDQETSELMIAFYRNWLEEKMPLSEAFYTAQKALAVKHPQQPELWAGFVLMQ